MKKREFLEIVEKFLIEYHFSPTRFGKKILNTPMFVFRLRKGCEAREETQNKVFAFIEKYESEER